MYDHHGGSTFEERGRGVADGDVDRHDFGIVGRQQGSRWERHRPAAGRAAEGYVYGGRGEEATPYSELVARAARPCFSQPDLHHCGIVAWTVPGNRRKRWGMREQRPIKVSFSFYPTDTAILTRRVAELKKAGVNVRSATVLRALIHI